MKCWMQTLFLVILIFGGTASEAGKKNKAAGDKGKEVEETMDAERRLSRICQPGSGGLLEVHGLHLLRNGDFEQKRAAWAGIAQRSGTLAPGPDGRASRNPGGWGAHFSAPGYLIQEVYPPTTVRQGNFGLDYRFEITKRRGSMLHLFEASLVTLDDEGRYSLLSTLFKFNRSTRLDSYWRRIVVSLDNRQLSMLSRGRSEAKPFYLLLRFEGEGVELDIDNVTYRVNGKLDYPRLTGMIAYLASQRSETSSGDPEAAQTSLRCISPDGAHSGILLDLEGNSPGASWSPDGEILAFPSDLEPHYSRRTSEIWGLSDEGLKKLTNPPSRNQAMSDSREIGVVMGTIRNATPETKIVLVYAQGSRFSHSVSVAPGKRARFVLDEVVDLGEGVNQWIVARIGRKTWEPPENGVDVEADNEIEMDGEIVIDEGGVEGEILSAPTWSHEGKELLFTGDKGLFMTALVDGTPRLWMPTTGGALRGTDPALSPVDDRLLYEAQGKNLEQAIWMAAPNKAPIAVREGSGDWAPKSPAWLPDGSGFVFVRRSCDSTGTYCGGDLYFYDFANKKEARITELYNERIESPTVSGDGKYVAFVRVLQGNKDGDDQRRELWVLELANPAIQWPLVLDGDPHEPSWNHEEPRSMKGE